MGVQIILETLQMKVYAGSILSCQIPVVVSGVKPPKSLTRNAANF